MPKKLDPAITDELKKHGFGKEAVWDCHGTWVVYHRVIEKIAAASKITFDPPQIIEAGSADGIAVVCVTGHMNGNSVWSIGEASPKNNKNAYCWAMAEKRAVDRVVLKLIGLHGLVYSEEEAEDFKASAPDRGEIHGPLGVTELKTKCRQFSADLAACDDLDSLIGLLSTSADLTEQMQRDLPDWWFGRDGSDVEGAKTRIEARRLELADRGNLMRAG